MGWSALQLNSVWTLLLVKTHSTLSHPTDCMNYVFIHHHKWQACQFLGVMAYTRTTDNTYSYWPLYVYQHGSRFLSFLVKLSSSYYCIAGNFRMVQICIFQMLAPYSKIKTAKIWMARAAARSTVQGANNVSVQLLCRGFETECPSQSQWITIGIS